MNKLETLLARFECGFITSPTLLAELVTLDRLHPVLVRCGACRFTCAAQCVEHLIRCIELGGDYVRDISLPTGSAERAAEWMSQPQTLMDLPKAEQAEYGAEHISPIQGPMIPKSTARGLSLHAASRSAVCAYPVEFNESDCGGVYDGVGTVTSDADSGL